MAYKKDKDDNIKFPWSELIFILGVSLVLANAVIKNNSNKQEIVYETQTEDENSFTIPLERLMIMRYRYKERYYTEVMYRYGVTEDEMYYEYRGINNFDHVAYNMSKYNTYINKLEIDTGEDIYETKDCYFLTENEVKESFNNKDEVSYEEICELEKKFRSESNATYQNVTTLNQLAKLEEKKNVYKKTDIATMFYEYNDAFYYKVVHKRITLNNQTFYTGVIDSGLVAVEDQEGNFKVYVEANGKMYEILEAHDSYYLNYEDNSEDLTYEEILSHELENPPLEIHRENNQTLDLKRNLTLN